MSASTDLFSDLGPSGLMEGLFQKFDDAVTFIEECYHNRAGGDIDEEENAITDQQLHYIMDDFIRTIKLMMLNKAAENA